VAWATLFLLEQEERIKESTFNLVLLTGVLVKKRKNELGNAFPGSSFDTISTLTLT